MSTLQFRQHVWLHTPLRVANMHQESQRRLTKTFPSTRNFIELSKNFTIVSEISLLSATRIEH
uniref:Uncharacterized protein n=1 Tax=Brassica campestris TaxID=3711 RepID=A0A3P6C112_BRACM|nr:unnamed protein product [Brassica rapa]